jgi:hypothetical protein
MSASVKIVFLGDESLHTENILLCIASDGSCRVAMIPIVPTRSPK